MSASVGRSALRFFLLVFLLSIPFWLAGALAPQFLQKKIPINLPVSALAAFDPMIAALILVYRKDGPEGAKRLLKRAVDYKRIKARTWYFPAMFLMPATMALEYGVLRWMGASLPSPQFPTLMVAIFFFVFFIAAIGEELGWQGYAFNLLQARWNALESSIILGLAWAIWHLIPFIQANHTPRWIAGQCVTTILARIIIVWLYNNAGQSVFIAILFHTMLNVSEFLFPNYGSHYDPLIASVIMALTAGIIIFLWGPKTLARSDMRDQA
jgi:membrane protease YdiL (CAAX protease family)